MKNRDVEKNLHKIYFVYNKIDQRRSSTYAINNVEDDSNRFQEFKLKTRKKLSTILPQEKNVNINSFFSWRLRHHNIDTKKTIVCI